MRKKLDTRFPAARIKKIMQADEDVGKIAMAVPVLVSKALELFLQDLCDRTYDITLERGAKTVSSLHLKHCVQSYNVFDFLKEVVGKVPDYGHSETAGDDANTMKRRKVAFEEINDSDEDSKKSRMNEMCHASSSGRGRGWGRGRGRGRGRGARATEKEASQIENDFESCTAVQQSNNQNLAPTGALDDGSESKELPEENIKLNNGAHPAVRNFDLNADLEETADKTPIEAVACPPSAGSTEVRGEAYSGWSLSEMDVMAIDPVHLAHLNSRLDEDEEDYDEEE